MLKSLSISENRNRSRQILARIWGHENEDGCQRAPKRGQVRALSKGANWTRMGRLISIRGISLPSSRNRRCQTGSQWTKHRELRSFLLPG